MDTRAIHAGAPNLEKKYVSGKGEYWLELTLEVNEPNRPTEFEIQALLYYELRLLGYNVRGEIKAKYETKENRRAVCRFDLVDFTGGTLKGIIEVKPSKTKHKTAAGWSATRQGWRYSRYGVPVMIVYGMDEALKLLAQVRERGALWISGGDLGRKLESVTSHDRSDS